MSFRVLLACCLANLSYTVLAFPPGINFIENKGQWPQSIFFHARSQGVSFDLQSGGFTYTFVEKASHDALNTNNTETHPDTNFNVTGHVLKSEFKGFDSRSKPEPFGIQPQYYNYFLGADQSKWTSLVHAYDGVIYPSFYKGIDLKVYSDGQNVKYEFIVSSGADPSQIQWSYSGAESVNVVNRDLIVTTPLGEVREKSPLVYQWIGDQKILIRTEYYLQGQEISFKIVDKYDPCYPLIIDPLLIFSTYSGSTADNWGSTATPGENGTLYSSGITNLYLGGTFPATAGSFQLNYGGVYDVAILKYDSTGSNLLYASYLGGSLSESPHSLVMDKDKNLLVLGTTSSNNFPTSSSAYQKTFAGGITLEQTSQREIPIPYEIGSDIFVAKISSDGTKLLASTYVGGSNNDGLNPLNSLLVKNYGDQMRGDIISDNQGNIYVSTVTSSPDFPIANGFNSTYKGGDSDALIFKLSGDLTQLLWGAFLGGNAADASHTIQIDHAGDIFVGGGSASADFPTTAGSYQTSPAGDVDGWIAKIKGDGSAIVTATLTGTPLFNQVYFLDLDKDENVYVYGQTVGTFPITTGVYSNPNSGQFVQKFDNSLSRLLLSTVFGSGIGLPNISPTAFLVNDCNNLFMSGWGGAVNSDLGFWNTSTFQMPVTSDALQKTTSGSDFYFIVLSGDASQLLYGTYLGGTSSRTHLDGGTCRFDKSGVVYHAVCSGCAAFNPTGHSTSDFPTSMNAWSRTNRSQNCNNAAFKFDLSSLKARIQTNSITLNNPGINQICLNDKIVFQNVSIGGKSYYWSLGDGSQQMKTDTSQIVHQYTNIGSYKVKLKIVDDGTCIGVDSTYVIINVSKPQGTVGPDQTICYNTFTQLIATGGTSYTWTSSDKTFISNSPNPIVGPTTSTSYFVMIEGNCVSMDTVNVKVVPGIDLKYKLETIFSCEGWPSVKVINETDPKEDVFFDFGDGNTSDQQRVNHPYSADGAFNVRLVGKKETCIYEKDTTVGIYYRFLPNAFTPEQSTGFNDTFMIPYGDKKPVPGQTPLKQISLQIYDRWGKSVYKNDNYKNDWPGNGDAGVYYYEATILDECTCKGWIQVIK